MNYQQYIIEGKDWYIGLTPSGYILFFNQETMDILESYEKPLPLLNNNHLIAQTFPDAKKTIKEKLKNDTKLIKSLTDDFKTIRDTISRNITNPRKYNEMVNLAKAFYLDIPLEDILAHQKRLKQILSYMETKEIPEGMLNLKTALPAAKAVLISDYITFNRAGFAKCPWHDEKTGSLKYYKRQNRVECFGCHKGGDCIDVVRQLYNLTLLQAVKFILKK